MVITGHNTAHSVHACAGGAVVCLGGRCTLNNVTFKGSTLLVLAGARTTLLQPSFRFSSTSESPSISLLVHGQGTKVFVTGGSVKGGSQGVSVQAGAVLEASDFLVSEIDVTGVEVKDKDSSLKLTGCKLQNFSESYVADVVRGVHIHSGSTADLSGVSVSCPHICFGVAVRTHAAATLTKCAVSHSRQHCVHFTSGAKGRVVHCSMTDSQDDGLVVYGAGTNAHAFDCTALRNSLNGMRACRGGCLTAHACMTSDNGRGGYKATGNRSILDLTGCGSSRDGCGCCASNGAMLAAREVAVRDSRLNGFKVGNSGEAVLRQCTASSCGVYGVCVLAGARVNAEGCRLERSGTCGAFATKCAVVVLQDCSSSENKGEGYSATDEAQVTVRDSSSDGDMRGCGVLEGGVLTMECVTVDGVCQSGTLR